MASRVTIRIYFLKISLHDHALLRELTIFASENFLVLRLVNMESKIKFIASKMAMVLLPCNHKNSGTFNRIKFCTTLIPDLEFIFNLRSCKPRAIRIHLEIRLASSGRSIEDLNIEVNKF
jgi:hypothetical protein